MTFAASMSSMEQVSPIRGDQKCLEIPVSRFRVATTVATGDLGGAFLSLGHHQGKLTHRFMDF
jgi:hypothetical protein